MTCPPLLPVINCSVRPALQVVFVKKKAQSYIRHLVLILNISITHHRYNLKPFFFSKFVHTVILPPSVPVFLQLHYHYVSHFELLKLPTHMEPKPVISSDAR